MIGQGRWRDVSPTTARFFRGVLERVSERVLACFFFDGGYILMF